MNILTQYIVPSGVILTFITSVWAITANRKTVRSSKYIDIITSERIKWIEKIRMEVCEIQAVLHEILFTNYRIARYKEEPIDTEDIFSSLNKERKITPLRNKLEEYSKTNLITKLNILKLRFNPVEDVDVIEKLDKLVFFLLKTSWSKEELAELFNINTELLDDCQKMLKAEWEKVKKEAKGVIS